MTALLDDARTAIAAMREADGPLPYSADVVERLLTEHEKVLALLEKAVALGNAIDNLPLSFYEMINGTRLSDTEQRSLRVVMKLAREWRIAAAAHPLQRERRRPSARRRACATPGSTRLVRDPDSAPDG